jgi:hypothetical protein
VNKRFDKADEKGFPAKKGLKLRVYQSHEEAALAEASDAALQQPIERIRETVSLILRVYGVTQQQLKSTRKKLHINITAGQ